MACKVGQIIAHSDPEMTHPVCLGCDNETKKRKDHNRTIHGPMREAQAHLTGKFA